jgi:3-phenylpropionate/trans-cinnamate dioxygenase ferredoxin reductase component
MADPVVAIIGAGQAGFQTAASLHDEGFGGKVLLIGDEPVLPYQRPPLSKSYLAGESGADELWLRPAEFYSSHQIELVHSETVTGIDRDRRRLRLGSGNEIAWDHLVLATGARCRLLIVPGAELDGVLPLRTLADADTLRDRLDKAHHIVVVGAGFIGLEFASVAIAHGADVHIIEVTRQAMGRVVSAQTSRFFTDAHIRWGAKVSFGTAVGRIFGTGGRVAGVVTTDGRHLPADLVLICIGVIPNAKLAREAGLEVDNGILVDEYLRTADPMIFAIGDCANFPTPFAPTAQARGLQANRRIRLESVQNAVDQARCVAAHIAGRPEPYRKVPWFWSDQGDLKLQIAGITAGHDEAVTRGDPVSGHFSVFCFCGGRLIGVESVNRPADHVVARRLLAGEPGLSPEQAADESYDLRAHARRPAESAPSLISGKPAGRCCR